MLFFFKPKTIHLDCFTDRSDVYEYSPIVRGTKCYPDWWKSLPNGRFDFHTMTPNNTMKQCIGFTDFFRESVCIRMWSDLAIKTIGYDFWYQFSDQVSSCANHNKNQYRGYVDGNDYIHMKMKVPWLFQCKTDVKWIAVGNVWEKNMNQDLDVLPGLLDLRLPMPPHIQIILKKRGEDLQKMYAHNTPMLHLFPMSEKKLVIHNHLISREEFIQKSISTSDFTFVSKGINSIKHLKSKEPKCPFH